MNGSSSKGGAFGYRLDVLPKLKDIPSTKNEISLLDFLRKTLKNSFPESLNAIQELAILETAKCGQFHLPPLLSFEQRILIRN